MHLISGIESTVKAFPVKLPSGVQYWTVLDEDLAVVDEADAYLRHLRFARDASELTTKSYAGAIAMYLRWCRRSGRHWHAGVGHLGLFMIWLRHAGPETSGVDAEAVSAGEVAHRPRPSGGARCETDQRRVERRARLRRARGQHGPGAG
jgi:hypothetical protein